MWTLSTLDLPLLVRTVPRGKQPWNAVNFLWKSEWKLPAIPNLAKNQLRKMGRGCVVRTLRPSSASLPINHRSCRQGVENCSLLPVSGMANSQSDKGKRSRQSRPRVIRSRAMVPKPGKEQQWSSGRCRCAWGTILSSCGDRLPCRKNGHKERQTFLTDSSDLEARTKERGWLSLPYSKVQGAVWSEEYNHTQLHRMPPHPEPQNISSWRVAGTGLATPGICTEY